MKLKYIILLVMSAVGVGIILSTYGDSTQYVNFDIAMQHQGKNYHVVGELDHTKPMIYNAKEDPNYFEFYLKDSLNTVSKVIYKQPKPADFERSDKIVVNGYYEKDHFYAKEILLKCPSKYNNAGIEAAKE